MFKSSSMYQHHQPNPSCRLSGAGEEVLDTGSRRRGIEGVKAGLLGLGTVAAGIFPLTGQSLPKLEKMRPEECPSQISHA